MPTERDGVDGGSPERRSNLTLRELLDEMIEMARHLSRNAGRMPESELTYSRDRMEWLATEIWEQATKRG
jgi:hypothetical protein